MAKLAGVRVKRGDPEMEILIADDDSSNRKHLRAPLVSRDFSDPILLIEQRWERIDVYYRHSDN